MTREPVQSPRKPRIQRFFILQRCLPAAIDRFAPAYWNPPPIRLSLTPAFPSLFPRPFVFPPFGFPRYPQVRVARSPAGRECGLHAPHALSRDRSERCPWISSTEPLVSLFSFSLRWWMIDEESLVVRGLQCPLCRSLKLEAFRCSPGTHLRWDCRLRWVACWVSYCWGWKE